MSTNISQTSLTPTSSPPHLIRVGELHLMRLPAHQQSHPAGGMRQPLLVPEGGGAAVAGGEVGRLVQQTGWPRVVECHTVNGDGRVAHAGYHLRGMW